MNFKEELEKEFGNKYDFLKLLSVVFSKSENTTTITFLFSQEIDEIVDEDRKILHDFFEKKLNLYSTLKLKFKKSFLDDDIIQSETLDILQKNFKSSVAEITIKDISVEKSESIFVKIYCSKLVYHFLDNRGANKIIERELSKRFIAHFIVNLEIDNKKEIDVSVIDKRELLTDKLFKNNSAKTKRYCVGDVFMMFGNDITPKPEYIKDIKSNKQSVILSGTISNFKKKNYTKKKEKAKGENAKQNAFYTFCLTDSSAHINCTYFSSITNEKKMDKLCDGCNIIIIGDIETFNNALTCYVRSLGMCSGEIETKEEIMEEISCQGQNRFVEPYVEKQQANIFEVKPKYNDLVNNNTIVVYDLETTGLDPNNNEIIEIGAVKLVNGEITEVFETLVKPENEIPAKITEITNITYDMVKDSPSIKEAFSEFYNFTRGSVLSGYNNIQFDDKFIAAQSRKLGFEFDNQSVDVLNMARSKLVSSNYKLGTVVKQLGIVLIDAHRASNDALATAKVLLKLNQI